MRFQMNLNNTLFMFASDILILTLNTLGSQLDPPIRDLHVVQGVPEMTETSEGSGAKAGQDQ